MICSNCETGIPSDNRNRAWARVGLCRGCWRSRPGTASRRFRLGREDKAFLGFMALCFAVMALDHFTGGALDAAYRAWRAGQ